MTSSMTSGANCKGNISSINANIIIVFLSYTCQKTISMNNTFRDCRSKVNITGLLGDLGTNKQHCKLSQIHFFLDCDGIDNVTLRLWKLSDFCSRHTVGVAGDDIMFHILVWCIYFMWYTMERGNFKKLWCNGLHDTARVAYRKISNIKPTLVCDKIFDHSNVVGASPVANYIFILDLTRGFNRLCTDSCKTREETFKFWDLVLLILENWR